jgi:predicted methyltransferase
MRTLVTTLLLVLPCLGAQAATTNLADAIASPVRSDANRARDAYRHPQQTLEFFGVAPTSTVVEVWPGGGWYTEILAPYLREAGIYYAAGPATSLPDVSEYSIKGRLALAEKLASNAVYDHVVLTELSAPQRPTMAPPGHVDFVLTFRNVHNWLAGGYADAMMHAFYRTLKPGGVLGVVEHRAKPGTSVEQMKKSGYMTEQYVIDLATAAGFTLAAKSEINANPQDTASYPGGVWTLPPNLRACQQLPDGAEKTQCVARYSAVGESDRMTLKFVKPAD